MGRLNQLKVGLNGHLSIRGTAPADSASRSEPGQREGRRVGV